MYFYTLFTGALLKEAFFMKKISLSTQKMAYIGLLTAVSIALNALTMPVLTGTTAISFTYIPCFIAGAFFGPFAGALVGLIGDVLGFLIAPKGVYIPFITVSSVLLGLIPGLIFKIKKMNPYIKIALSFLLIFIFCTLTLNTIGLYIFFASKKTIGAYLALRLPNQSIIFAINVAIVYAIYPLLKTSLFRRLQA